MLLAHGIGEMGDDVIAWRRHLHQNPELLYDVHATARFITDKLSQFGCDVIETGIGETGVVGLIKGTLGEGPVIGLRADMDALPILERSGKSWASKISGRAHSCGHDGHMAMLLGATRHLSGTRNFRGAVAVIFQPAEEGGAGALAMVKDGLMERFDIERVFGMHNEPMLPVGYFAIRAGAILAAADTFDIVVHGRGGHAGQPHLSIDPIVVASHLVIALQTIVSRETEPSDALVITVASIQGGNAHNVIPNTVRLTGTVRTLNAGMRAFAERRLKDVTRLTTSTFGATADVSYNHGYPVTFNHEKETEIALEAAKLVVNEKAVASDIKPRMAAEDFAYMLESRPGAFIIIGNGETPGLHNPAYDFNDDAIPFGVSYWVRLVETILSQR